MPLQIIFCEFIKGDTSFEQRHTALVIRKELVKENLIIQKKTTGRFPGGSVVKNPPANAGDTSSISGSGRPPGEGKDKPPLPGKSQGPRSLEGCSPLCQRRIGHNLATRQQQLLRRVTEASLPFIRSKT